VVTEDSITGCYGELCVSGNRVVWYEGLHPHNKTVRKVYSVESEVLQTFWCTFGESVSSSDGGSSGEGHSLRCLCVREHTCLTLFMQTGGVHYVPLPFLVSAPQPLHSSTSPFQTFHSSISISPFPHLSIPKLRHVSFLLILHKSNVQYIYTEEELLCHRAIQTLINYNHVKLFLPSSSCHPPCQVNQAWPISSGLLLERQMSSEGGSDGLPILFTLLNPMDDFCPTTFRRPAASETTLSARELTAVNFRTVVMIRMYLGVVVYSTYT